MKRGAPEEWQAEREREMKSDWSEGGNSSGIGWEFWIFASFALCIPNIDLWLPENQ